MGPSGPSNEGHAQPPLKPKACAACAALPVHACVQYGCTALHAATSHLECLKELLATGAAVDLADDVSGACCALLPRGPGGEVMGVLK